MLNSIIIILLTLIVLLLSLALIWLSGVALFGMLSLIRSVWRRKHGLESAPIPEPPLTPADWKRTRTVFGVLGLLMFSVGAWKLAIDPAHWRDSLMWFGSSPMFLFFSWAGFRQPR